MNFYDVYHTLNKAWIRWAAFPTFGLIGVGVWEFGAISGSGWPWFFMFGCGGLSLSILGLEWLRRYVSRSIMNRIRVL